jgi:hypothetical protein
MNTMPVNTAMSEMVAAALLLVREEFNSNIRSAEQDSRITPAVIGDILLITPKPGSIILSPNIRSIFDFNPNINWTSSTDDIRKTREAPVNETLSSKGCAALRSYASRDRLRTRNERAAAGDIGINRGLILVIIGKSSSHPVIAAKQIPAVIVAQTDVVRLRNAFKIISVNIGFP